ncbi:phenylalanine--tRNA ligase subunit beta [Fuchsiella alkaliacetigena]|uniref:phenylalanine--tRNA ligase subunit beta n=1 Tax=Fuchsiella alkaliacetigena TaxID=957042 RepID=UPI00200A242D|nr:phenylalanine--tRNA ligase subunit beta [Fuchsiella alkaliacetigena]MCK8825055.1 phenylalanine--tRNA ligase subunit beta [Fuchsiella alkaliacetigena]
MKVSYKWLQEYIDFDYTPQELAHKLTMVGLEVDQVEFQAAGLADIVVGEVLEINDHQNADKLSVCEVDLGSTQEQIVCGAKNMEVGDKVPVAPVGSTLPGGMEIKEVELRGVKSRGMMCSADELELQEERAEGLLILPNDLEVGASFVEVWGLDDIVFELDLTPNYADCLNILGVAREIAAMTGNPLQMPEPEVEESAEAVSELTSVQVEDEELCPRYTAQVIKDVKVEESPQWLQRRLEAAGIRPINNIVDVTNYVMMEFGQPMHAFDYDQLTENRIVVRTAQAGEKIVTLDEEERELDEEILVIADAEEPVCIAGVMGGLDSEVSAETTNVLLEAANFDPIRTRQTAKKLGLHSESSHRFERGVDINGAVRASNRAVELILELGGGEVAQGVIDVYPNPVEAKELDLRVNRVNSLLGTEIAKEEMMEMLAKLEFEVSSAEAGVIKVKVPTFRGDVSREADLVEEIARVYGYERIEAELPAGPIIQGKKNKQQFLRDKTLELCTGLGLSEVMTFSFISYADLDRLGLPADSQLREAVELANPLSSDYEIMRTTLVPSLLEALSRNLNHNCEQVEIFELSKVFIPTESGELPVEREVLAGALMQESEREEVWNLDAVNFFTLKGKLEEYLEQIGISDYQFTEGENTIYHPGRVAEVEIAGEAAGFLGELHPNLIEEYDLLPRTVIFELEFAVIVEHTVRGHTYSELPKYPASTRDIALVVGEEINSQQIEKVIKEVAGDLIERIELFDQYRGEQIGQDAKSLAYSLSYRANDRTLTVEEVNELQAEIEAELDNRLGAKIRE